MVESQSRGIRRLTMRPILALCAILVCTPALADKPTLDQWEKSLQDKAKNGTLPGPKPGQKCLWSEKLKACLWYTPGKWDTWRK